MRTAFREDVVSNELGVTRIPELVGLIYRFVFQKTDICVVLHSECFVKEGVPPPSNVNSTMVRYSDGMETAALFR